MPFVKYVSIFILIMALFARQYIYTMIVTFDLPMRGLVKNAFAFAFLGLPRNVGVVLLQIALLVIMIFVPFVDIFFMPLFFLSLTGFASMFATYPVIYKHMVLPVLEEEKNKETEQEDE
jgi:uncharacterized membrane protein YesL